MESITFMMKELAFHKPDFINVKEFVHYTVLRMSGRLILNLDGKYYIGYYVEIFNEVIDEVIESYFCIEGLVENIKNPRISDFMIKTDKIDYATWCEIK